MVARHARITVNPSEDQEFVATVERLAKEVSDARALERRLREKWPRAVVRSTELTAEPAPTLYVYRDGSWSGGHASRVIL